MRYFISIFLCFFVLSVYGQTDRQKSVEIVEKLTDLQNSIELSADRINNLMAQLKQSIDNNEKNLIQMQLIENRDNLKQLQDSFKTFVTGGVDFSVKEDMNKKFDWQKELVEIVQPLIGELKDITNKPRQIAKLKQIITTQEIQVKKHKRALDNAHAIAKFNLPSSVDTEVDSIIENHNRKYLDAKRIYDVALFKFKEKTTDAESFLESSNRKIKKFIQGRGLTLFLSAMSFATIMVMSYFLPKLIFIRRKQRKILGFYQRIGKLVYQGVSVLLAMVALLMVLYIRNDWALMGLAIIFIFLMALGLKNNVPKYLSDIKLLLNISTVREKERVVYQGIPWRVEKIGFFTTLINPQLHGGKIRIYLKDLAKMHSRRYNSKEPWFPCREKEFVLLDDDTYGKVVVASPESVLLQGYGGSIMTYPTAIFLEKRPLNLSELGFSVRTVFGVDYALQQESTTSVPKKLEKYVKEQILKQNYGKFFETLKIKFDTANSSSLDYFIFAKFTGEAAMYYRDIQRDLQKFATECCNKYNWTIPFTQLTLHKAEQ